MNKKTNDIGNSKLFAAAVKASAARNMTFGRKALISDIHEDVGSMLNMDLDSLKAALVVANTAGTVEVARLDMPRGIGGRDQTDKMIASEINHMGATLHCVYGR